LKKLFLQKTLEIFQGKNQIAFKIRAFWKIKGIFLEVCFYLFYKAVGSETVVAAGNYRDFCMDFIAERTMRCILSSI